MPARRKTDAEHLLETNSAVLTARLGDTMRPVLGKGIVERWLDVTQQHNKNLNESLALIDRELQLQMPGIRFTPTSCCCWGLQAKILS